MNKQTTRAFASGLLISALILYAYVQFFQKKPEPVVSIKEGYMEIKKSDYETLKKESKDWQEKYKQLSQKKDEEKTANVTEPIIKNYRLVISEGMASKEICTELENAGLIDDAEDFNDYLANKNLQKYIQIGTYELNDTMTFEEISNIIAKES
ncbi:endolytic transglycosylase MltG [Lederbergia citri]|uniref:Endolytic transglycosylase MltG n=1 Tax=Lederbergia citri TaxID=2833580 RepID=A0A942YGH3_9BACI|nr:endolytic transglycosylase MltG [Lederbergia citri]MBS4194689.1 endolytic transglycosylase MltG [Lederbergia citri]